MTDPRRPHLDPRAPQAVRHPKVRPLARSLGAVALAAILLNGCGSPTEPEPAIERFSDFAVAGAQTLAGDALIPDRIFCSDATRLGIPLSETEGIAADLETLGDGARLSLSGCERRNPWIRVLPPAEVHVTLRDAEGDELHTERLPVDGTLGWWAEELDLSPWAGRSVRLELTYHPSPDDRREGDEEEEEEPRELLLGDFNVRHFLPASVPLKEVLDEHGLPRGGSALAIRGLEIQRTTDSAEGNLPAGTDRGAALPKDAGPNARDAIDGEPLYKNPAAPEFAKPRQILLISVDTLRQDAIGAFRPPDAERSADGTPHLDALADDGQIWRRHYSTESWTKPAHATLLTGFPPSVYGGPDGLLEPAVPTLAERLQGAGFATHGQVYDCVWINPRFGYGRGFDLYRSGRWNTEQSVRQAVNWMGENRDRSFFFFLHTFEPHSDFLRLPYEAPGIDRRTITARWDQPRYGCAQGTCGSKRLKRVSDGELGFFPREREILRYLYDAGVSETDRALGQLIATLKEWGLYDDMMIVITSDHGEMLGEGGELLHGQSLEPVLKVPLVIKWPGGEGAGQAIDNVSSGLDLVPTILDAYDLPTDGLMGSPLPRRREDRPAFAGINWRVVVQGPWKATFDNGSVRLVHLGKDPTESHDVSAEHPEVLRRLRKLMGAYNRQSRHQLETLRRSAPSAASPDGSGLSPEEIRELEALGYLGG